jgi:hypothetical protein
VNEMNNNNNNNTKKVIHKLYTREIETKNKNETKNNNTEIIMKQNSHLSITH